MKFLRLISVSFFLLNFSLHAQNFEYILFRKLSPPEIIIPPDAQTMAFIHRNIQFESDTIQKYYSYINKVILDTNDYEQLLLDNIYNTFTDTLSELYNFDTINFLQLAPENIKKTLPTFELGYPPIDWEVLDSISEATVSDIIVSLEKIAVFTNYEIYQYPYYPNLYGVIEIIPIVNWKIYDPYLRKVLHDKLYTDTLYIEEIANSLTTLKTKFLSRENIMKEVGKYVGNNFAQKISPQWKTGVRQYFLTAKDKRMKEATVMAKIEKFDEAISLWENIYNSNETYKIKGKTAYNIAVFSEINNNILSAEEWIEKSLVNLKKANKIKELNYVKAYKDILKKRKEEIRKIHELFSPVELE